MMDAQEKAADLFRRLQTQIVAALESFDGTRFRDDAWDRPGGGGGVSRVLVDGGVFEKAGVNFSLVHGELTPDFAKQLPGDGPTFFATGVSLVLHPRNPHVPTVHANFRYIEHGQTVWFGGGSDLTPYYPVREDVIHFHKAWKTVCDRYPGIADHRRMKEECDRYFFLPHRQESRGVGGIFFDDLHSDGAYDFVEDAGNTFLTAYLPIAERRRTDAYGDRERQFQLYRRGRYVEFNLIYDRGTLFGLKTAGRVESILMSLPPLVRYEYDYRPEPGSREEELTRDFLPPQDWAAQE